MRLTRLWLANPLRAYFDDLLLLSFPFRWCAFYSGETALLATQVTTRSPMGAVVYHTGGILVDHGWIRILGAGECKLMITIRSRPRVSSCWLSYPALVLPFP